MTERRFQTSLHLPVALASDPRPLALLALTLGVALLAAWSLSIGSSPIAFSRVVEALFQAGNAREDLIVRTVRLPRAAIALASGAVLAAAGAIMQAVTRNPLAEPGLLGVNAGAAFAIVVALVVSGGDAGRSHLIWMAFAGAAAAAVVVYVLGSAGRSGATPVNLVLAGVVVSTFLGSITMAVLILDAHTFEVVRTWTAGSLRGRELADLLAALPYMAAGLIASCAVGRQMTTISLGADIARPLGQNQAVWRLVAATLVVAMAGGAVAVSGPVAFVGLVAPHMARMTVGADYRWILPFSAVTGAGLTLAADAAPRALLEIDAPIGITLAMFGAPYLIWLVRRNARRLA